MSEAKKTEADVARRLHERPSLKSANPLSSARARGGDQISQREGKTPPLAPSLLPAHVRSQLQRLQIILSMASDIPSHKILKDINLQEMSGTGRSILK